MKPPATNTTVASRPLALCMVMICTAARSLSRRCALASAPGSLRRFSMSALREKASSRTVQRERAHAGVTRSDSEQDGRVVDALEDADSQELADAAPQVVAALQKLPQLRDVASVRELAA